jgi:hypothetical protein
VYVQYWMGGRYESKVSFLPLLAHRGMHRS